MTATELLAKFPWQRALLALLYGGLTLIVLPIAIPMALSYSNESKLRQEARVKRAVDFGVRNNEFNIKLNSLRTSMFFFLDQAFDMNLSPEQLRAEQDQFRKEWTQQYLLFDQMAWWWHWDMQRETEVLNLCSPAKFAQLNSEIRKYHASVNTSVTALGPLWEQLRSDKLSLDEKDELERMRKAAQDTIGNESEVRKELTRVIGSLLAYCDQ